MHSCASGAKYCSWVSVQSGLIPLVFLHDACWLNMTVRGGGNMYKFNEGNDSTERFARLMIAAIV